MDTNVLISAGIVVGSRPFNVLQWVINHGRLLLSREVIEEFTTRFIPRTKFDRYLSERGRRDFVTEVVAASEVIVVTTRLAVCADPDDDKVLALAVDGRADCVVTGNTRHFPPEHAGVPVLTPAAFAERYAVPAPPA